MAKRRKQKQKPSSIAMQTACLGLMMFGTAAYGIHYCAFQANCQERTIGGNHYVSASAQKARNADVAKPVHLIPMQKPADPVLAVFTERELTGLNEALAMICEEKECEQDAQGRVVMKKPEKKGS